RSAPRSVIAGKRPEHFIEFPVVAIDYQHMSIAIGVWPTFDRRIPRHRIRPRIAFTRVGGEIDRHPRLRTRYHNVGNAVGHAAIERAEIRMETVVGTNRRDDSI